jgi:hypothetical protein
MKKLIVIIAILLTIPTIFCIFLIVYLGNNNFYSRDLYKQEIIVSAYIKYMADKHKTPSSLEDLVRAKYLPEYGFFILSLIFLIKKFLTKILIIGYLKLKRKKFHPQIL